MVYISTKYNDEWIKTRTSKSTITNYDIHSSINGGLMDTKIKLFDGTNKWLSNVRIGDILDGNIKVLGVVTVLPKDLKIFKSSLSVIFKFFLLPFIANTFSP